MKLLMFASIICMESTATSELKKLLCLALKVFLIIYNGFFQNEIDSVVTVSPLGLSLLTNSCHSMENIGSTILWEDSLQTFFAAFFKSSVPPRLYKICVIWTCFFLWKQEKKTKYLFLLASFLLKCKQGKFSVLFCFNSF